MRLLAKMGCAYGFIQTRKPGVLVALLLLIRATLPAWASDWALYATTNLKPTVVWCPSPLRLAVTTTSSTSHCQWDPEINFSAW
jgi:hypothetical protein